MSNDRYKQLYVPVVQALVSYWLGEIPLSQTSILLYVNERTLRYGKMSEEINRTHFLQGVRDSQGGLIHNGLKLQHTTLWKHIKELEDRALLRIEHKPRKQEGNIYALSITNIMEPVSSGLLQTFATQRKRKIRRR